MNRPHHPRRPWLALSVLLVPLIGCVQGENVNPYSLAQARRTWDQTKPADYDLEWTVSGARKAHYLVSVRAGSVQSIESVGADGKKSVLHPPDPSYYSVEGLFRALEDEANQLLEPRPFGLPEGTVPKLEFDPDPSKGYPRRYRRHVNRREGGLALDVIRLETNLKTEKKSDVKS
ncbi:MAG TPA: DUF6174 domain-containing protein [Isosphaeraceae bacterium]|nr:DUF6174 domain-containing protein [Isosphaeraceae bacterium]